MSRFEVLNVINNLQYRKSTLFSIPDNSLCHYNQLAMLATLLIFLV